MCNALNNCAWIRRLVASAVATVAVLLSKGPVFAGYGGGDSNLYRYVGNAPTNELDPTGEEIYLSKGQKGKWDPVGIIHQDIAVDKWKKNACGDLVKDGVESFSFGVTDTKTKKDYAEQKSWLGFSDFVAVLFGLSAGKHLEGEIYSSTFDPKAIVSTLKTTPAEDQEWLKYMKGRLGTRDRYTVLWNNCVNYTNHEFGAAKERFGFK
jgi:hypothetical protein